MKTTARQQRTLVIIFLSTVLGFQAVASFRVFCVQGFTRIGCAPRLWPFLDYPMYSELRRPGESTTVWLVRVELAGGQQVVLDPLDLAAKPPPRHLAKALLDNDSDRVQRWIAKYENANGVTLDHLQLEETCLLFTKSGFEEGETQVVRNWSSEGGIE